MIKCPNCKEMVGIIGKFCDNCGKPIQEEIQEHVKRERERGGENVDSNTGDKDN
jgi:predicted amidophosphoribosyltransferase